MVPLERGLLMPFNPSVGRSGFMEWLALFIPCFRGGPVDDRVVGIIRKYFTRVFYELFQINYRTQFTTRPTRIKTRVTLTTA